jgi:hypothetical protein
MWTNPVVAQALARERVAELRSSGASPPRRRRRPDRAVDAARRAAGWLLVDLGLRLAAPRGAMNRAVARGQR